MLIYIKFLVSKIKLNSGELADLLDTSINRSRVGSCTVNNDLDASIREKIANANALLFRKVVGSVLAEKRFVSNQIKGVPYVRNYRQSNLAFNWFKKKKTFTPVPAQECMFSVQ